MQKMHSKQECASTHISGHNIYAGRIHVAPGEYTCLWMPH